MQSMCHLLASALLLSSTLLSSTAPASEPPPLVDVFVGGQDGYPAYRIPSLVATKRGTLLAFAEARATLRDHAENDIVLKRSTDQGRTWQAAQVKPGLSPYTWQLWRADITVDSSVHDVRVRATNGQGTPQIREEAPPFPSGATGYHDIAIAVS